MDCITSLSRQKLLKKLWAADPHIKNILVSSKDLSVARERMFTYIDNLEEKYFDVHGHSRLEHIHVFEKENAKHCIRVLKNIIRSENEVVTGFSALQILMDISTDQKSLSATHEGFLAEFIALFKGINGNSCTLRHTNQYFEPKGRKAALQRSKILDSYARKMSRHMKYFKTGYDADLLKKRKLLKADILKKFGGSEDDWNDYRWHLDNVIRDAKTLSSLVKLSKQELEGVELAKKSAIPFEITPHYLSLFNKGGKCDHDLAIRAQVLPSTCYAKNVVENRAQHNDLDFMGEKSTSPIDCITRRYPEIVILKPYNSCPQICVYCQRNWEIKNMDEAHATRKKIKKAIDWVRKNKNITEVLVTGGDPLTLDNDYIDWILYSLSAIKHIERIRIGTRTPITIPFRFNTELLTILSKYHKLGKREIVLVTHVEHPTEMTPDTLDAIKKVKSLGISVYNQQVFTYFNSKRFETCFLRKVLKVSGIDPYYTFNTKGKAETIDFRVPIARIAQERKEEARILPGIVRTDEPVFNVPKLGKSHLRAWHHHEPIMIRPDGKRIYRFYPWESRLKEGHDYIYTDVSIYDYLTRLSKDGVNVKNYSSIWYYF